MSLHEPIRANYDRLSQWYDLFSGSEKRVTETGLRMLEPKPGSNILEIGCGTGHALQWLERAGVHATGLDLSFKMVTRARKLGIRSASRFKLCQGDAMFVPFRSTSFNAILLSFTLELFPDNEIPSVLAECRRLLYQDGTLGVVAIAREKTRSVRLYDWFHYHWPRVVDCRPINLDAALVSAGYKINQIQRMSLWGLPVKGITAIPS